MQIIITYFDQESYIKCVEIFKYFVALLNSKNSNIKMFYDWS